MLVLLNIVVIIKLVIANLIFLLVFRVDSSFLVRR
jgi:hypothetical protein